VTAPRRLERTIGQRDAIAAAAAAVRNVDETFHAETETRKDAETETTSLAARVAQGLKELDKKSWAA